MVEGARLESVLSRKGYESSNLSLSAKMCSANFGEISPKTILLRKVFLEDPPLNFNTSFPKKDGK